MAIFERKIHDKILVDDTKPLKFSFIEAVEINNHIEYGIKVWREPDWEAQWLIKHRYSDFIKLHSSLSSPTIKLPNLPPKKVFGTKEREFIDERKNQLEQYLKKVFEIPFVPSSLQARKFLDPENNNGNFLEEARQSLLVILRSGGSHEISEPIPNLGTRIKKYNFLGHPLANPKATHLLWWAKFGPDRISHLRNIHAALTTLLQCQHLYISSAVASVATDSGVCVIRPWYSQGSLRDYIFGVKPHFDCVLKYTNNKRREIDVTKCAVYGRQILEALNFLHERGIAHGALHTGNVVIDNKVCKLLDMENQLVGLPHILRPHMVKLKKINSMEAIDIYSFGHLLYEMVFHDPLETECCDQFPMDCDPLCRSVLESILSTEACKNGLPSAAGLLTHPFFTEVPLVSYEKPCLKLSSKARETFIATYENIIKRLKDDQKKVKLKKLQERADAFLSGDPTPLRTERRAKKSNATFSSTTDENPSSSADTKTCDSDGGFSSSPKVSIGNEPVESYSTEKLDKLFPDDIIPVRECSPYKEEVITISPSPEESSTPRNSLLDSISNFNKNNLRKLRSN